MNFVPIRRGAAMVMAIVTLMVVSLVAATLVHSLVTAHRQMRRQQDELQAQWLADAAVARATAQLALRSNYTGETWQPSISDTANQIGIVAIRAQTVGSQPNER